MTKAHGFMRKAAALVLLTVLALTLLPAMQTTASASLHLDLSSLQSTNISTANDGMEWNVSSDASVSVTVLSQDGSVSSFGGTSSGSQQFASSDSSVIITIQEN